MPVKKGKSGRIQRALKAKEPKVVEGAKRLLLVRGPATSEISTSAAKDLIALKKPEVKVLARKNEIRPFEDVSSLEFLCEKNECAAFLYVSHNKKRPHNLVLGRIFDGHVYDLLELGITKYEGLDDFPGAFKKALGSTPCMTFTGEEWDSSPDLKLLRNMLLDIFGSRDMTGISLQGMDHVLAFSCTNSSNGSSSSSEEEGAAAAGAGAVGISSKGISVQLRGYFMSFKQAEGRIPKVELAPMGPFLDFTLRRVQHASAALEKEAMRIPKELKSKKVKNVSHDEFTGEAMGRIHMERQDFNKLELKKTKASKLLKKRGRDEMEGEDGEEDDDNDGEGEEEAPVAVKAAAAPAAKRQKKKKTTAGADEDDE